MGMNTKGGLNSSGRCSFRQTGGAVDFHCFVPGAVQHLQGATTSGQTDKLLRCLKHKTISRLNAHFTILLNFRGKQLSWFALALRLAGLAAKITSKHLVFRTPSFSGEVKKNTSRFKVSHLEARQTVSQPSGGDTSF